MCKNSHWRPTAGTVPRQLRGLSWLFQSRGECDRDCPRQCPRHPSRDVSRRGLLACLLLALSLLVRTLLTREDTSHTHSFTHVSLLTRPEHEKRIALPSHLVSSGFDHSIPIFLSIHPTATSRCIRTEHTDHGCQPRVHVHEHSCVRRRGMQQQPQRRSNRWRLQQRRMVLRRIQRRSWCNFSSSSTCKRCSRTPMQS